MKYLKLLSYLFESKSACIFEVGPLPPKVRMRLVLDDEDDVSGYLVWGLVALPLEGDLGAGLPAGLDADGQDFLFFAGGAVVGHHSPRDLHPLRHTTVDVLQ